MIIIYPKSRTKTVLYFRDYVILLSGNPVYLCSPNHVWVLKAVKEMHKRGLINTWREKSDEHHSRLHTLALDTDCDYLRWTKGMFDVFF